MVRPQERLLLFSEEAEEAEEAEACLVQPSPVLPRHHLLPLVLEEHFSSVIVAST